MFKFQLEIVEDWIEYYLSVRFYKMLFVNHFKEEKQCKLGTVCV
jgi:hypothetical protein